jgi:hypothetical protein
MIDDAILWEIHKHTYNYFRIFKQPGSFDPMMNCNTLRELILICYTFPFLRIICDYLFEPLKHLLTGLEDNVAFMEIDMTFEFCNGCDWCSICNGILETARINLQRNPDAPLDIIKLEILNSYLYFALEKRKPKLSQTNGVWRHSVK